MRDAVLALGMGGPDSIDAIKPFLGNLLSDREIINFGIGPFQNSLARFIARRRSRRVAPSYMKMGGGSPQLPLTQALMDKVAPAYKAKTGNELDVFIGMSYWHPFIEDAMADLLRAEKEKPYRRVYLLPLYPQYATVTTGTCYTRVNKIFSLTAPKAPVCRINQFHLNEGYLKCIADRVFAAANKLGCDIKDCHLLFSAHSAPLSVIEAGDPYVLQLREQVAELVKMIQPGSHSLSYQSKLGRQQWLRPSSLEEVKTLADSGKKNIIVFAISFINDHIETLIEIDEELVDYGKSLGVNILRAESLNNGDDFAAVLADLLADI